MQRGKNSNSYRTVVQKLNINDEIEAPLESTRASSSITEKIDSVAFFLFLALYILFNFAYFFRYKK